MEKAKTTTIFEYYYFGIKHKLVDLEQAMKALKATKPSRKERRK
jgi:hypothetical protein